MRRHMGSSLGDQLNSYRSMEWRTQLQEQVTESELTEELSLTVRSWEHKTLARMMGITNNEPGSE